MRDVIWGVEEYLELLCEFGGLVQGISDEEELVVGHDKAVNSEGGGIKERLLDVWHIWGGVSGQFGERGGRVKWEW